MAYFPKVTYTGTTNGSGLYVVSYPQQYPLTPMIVPVLISPTTEQLCRIVSSSNTGFTIQVFQRASLTVLGINLLSFATTPVAGVDVSVLVTPLT